MSGVSKACCSERTGSLWYGITSGSITYNHLLASGHLDISGVNWLKQVSLDADRAGLLRGRQYCLCLGGASCAFDYWESPERKTGCRLWDGVQPIDLTQLEKQTRRKVEFGGMGPVSYVLCIFGYCRHPRCHIDCSVWAGIIRRLIWPR